MFDKSEDAQRLSAYLRTTGIIIGAMMMGIVSFTGVVLFLGQQQGPNANPQSLVSYLAVAGFVAALFAWWLIPDLVTRNLIGQIAAGTWTPPRNVGSGHYIASAAFPSDAAKLLAVNQTHAIIAAALLEGAAFFACIAYVIEGQTFVLAVPGTVLALLALTFPTRGRVVQWAETQQMRINDMRSEGIGR